MTIKVHLGGFNRALAEIKVQMQGATHQSAQAGAQVIYEQARLNANALRSPKGHWFHGTQYRKTGKKYWFDAGNLRDSIYQVFSRDNSNTDKTTFHVSWNFTKAPYAHMVEFGTSRSGAHPFMSSAITQKRDEAAQAMRKVFLEKMKS